MIPRLSSFRRSSGRNKTYHLCFFLSIVVIAMMGLECSNAFQMSSAMACRGDRRNLTRLEGRYETEDTCRMRTRPRDAMEIRMNTRNKSRTILTLKSTEEEVDKVEMENLKSLEKKKDDDSPPITNYLPIILPLLLVYVSNQWSRSSLYYLVNFSDNPTVTSLNAMNIDLHFSEAQYGALASVAFTALFAIASLFAGSLADRTDRKLLTISSALAWSAATLATASSSDYSQVVFARIAMGLACAFATPSAYTLLRDFVPRERAALASSLYGSGVYFGGGLASLSILLDDSLGWRGALVVIGVYGVLSAMLAFLFLPPDPKLEETNEIPDEIVESKGIFDKFKQGDNNKDTNTNDNNDNHNDSSSVLADVQQVLSTPRIRWLFLASFLRFSSGLCIGVWSAPYFRLAFPDDSTSYALVNALIVGLCGVSSGILGGWAADKAGAYALQSQFEESVGRLAVPVLGSLLAVPAWWCTVHASSFESAMAWLAVEYLVAECWFGPTVAVLQSTVGPRTGGTAQGMFTLTGAIGNFAPSLLGVLYGQVTTNALLVNEDASLALSNLLGIGVCAGYFLSALCFIVSAQASNETND